MAIPGIDESCEGLYPPDGRKRGMESGVGVVLSCTSPSGRAAALGVSIADERELRGSKRVDTLLGRSLPGKASSYPRTRTSAVDRTC
nr:hypothetical protein CFP56_09539 [Quercus suber]